MRGQATYRSRIISTVALLVLFTGYCMTQDLPERCTKTKPRSQMKKLNCPHFSETGKGRRWFLHLEKGCKKSGYCDPQDTDVLDPMARNNANINYFLTEEDCVQTCMTWTLTCPTLESIPNGSVSNNGSGYWGTSVHYTCNEGYSLIGESVRTCQRISDTNNAVWTGTTPVCRAKCPPPAFSKNPLFDISPKTHQEFYNHGDAIHYTCKPGYMGNSTRRVCMEDGTWSNGEPACKPLEVQCPEPKHIDHAQEPTAPERMVGSVVTYECQANFMLSGNSSRECSETGEWAGDEPFCWKFSIKMCTTEDCTVESARDVTNQTVMLQEKQANIRFFKVFEGQNPFPSMSLTWDPELNSIQGVDITAEGELVITSVLKDTMAQATKYTLYFGKLFYVYFNLDIEQLPVGNMEQPPTPLRLDPTKQTTSLDSEVKLTCLFQGNPSPDVVWYHNNQFVENTSRISIENTHFASSFTTSSLTINPVREEDLGKYKCKGFNSVGMNFSNEGEVSVQDSRSISSSSSQSLSKRSLDNWDGLSLCTSNAPSDTVTVVAKVKRSPELNVPGLTMYRMKVDRVITPTSAPVTSRHIRTIVMDTDSETPDKLTRNSLYILQGKLHENTLVVESHESVMDHSLGLEHSLRHC